MKKFFAVLLEIIFWFLDFDNILVFILIPVGLIAIGVMAEAGWLYYPVILGVYALIVYAINRALNKAAERSVKRFSDWLDKRKK